MLLEVLLAMLSRAVDDQVTVVAGIIQSLAGLGTYVAEIAGVVGTWLEVQLKFGIVVVGIVVVVGW